jgi:hypothetical protein
MDGSYPSFLVLLGLRVTFFIEIKEAFQKHKLFLLAQIAARGETVEDHF